MIENALVSPIEPPTPHKKRTSAGTAILLAVVAVFALSYSAYQSGLLPNIFETTAEARPSPTGNLEPPPRRTPLLPVDFTEVNESLGKRRGYAEQVEKEMLEEYDRQNGSSEKYYKPGRVAAQLFGAYAAAGSSPHGECYLQIANDYARQARRDGSKDPLMMGICEVFVHLRAHSSNAQAAQEEYVPLKKFLESNYPLLVRLKAVGAGLHNVANVDTEDNQAMKTFVDMATPELTSKAISLFKEFAATPLPQGILSREASGLIDNIDNNPKPLDNVGNALLDDLQKARTTEAEFAHFQGDLYINRAWAARTSAWAKKVTPEGWQGMRTNLAEAETILDNASEKFPEDPYLPALMITVELGQGMGEHRMNYWFKKSIEADPNCYAPYGKKIYYLQPKWYGSVEDVLKFGAECAATQRWDAGIPLALICGLLDLSEETNAIYQDRATWKLVQDTCSEYLRRYPKSLRCRTQYFILAMRAQQWEIAKEQIRLLGEDYDRFVLSDSAYRKLVTRFPKGT